MLRPVGRADTGVLNCPTVDRHIVAYINSYVGDWHAAVIGASKKMISPGFASAGRHGRTGCKCPAPWCGAGYGRRCWKIPADEAEQSKEVDGLEPPHT